MTQLIGALCENRTKVILISDRMVSTADSSLAFEHEPKFVIVSLNALVLTAGTIHEPELITDICTNGSLPLREIADNLATSYRRIRKKRVEEEVLSTYGFLSYVDYHEKNRALNEDMNFRIGKQIADYELGVELMLGGVDKKAHLYRIGEPGTYKSFDELGFCTIGSGDMHSAPVFAFYEFKPTMTASDTLQIAYEAKKRAEMAGGVGNETDAWILSKEGCYEITQETIKTIDEFRKERSISVQFRREFEIQTRKMECETS